MSITQTLHGTAIGLPISWGGARGVNVGIYGSPMECLGKHFYASFFFLYNGTLKSRHHEAFIWIDVLSTAGQEL